MKKILLLLIIALGVGCTADVSKKGYSPEKFHELLEQTIFVIPDSLMTKEQLQLYVKVFDFLVQYTYVENNCMKLSVGKEVLEKEGIPAIYYDVLQYQFEENNECIKKWTEAGDVPAIHLNQDSLFKEFKVRYQEIDRPKMMKRIEAK